MDIFWAFVGALWAAYSWVSNTIARISLTDLLLIILIYEVYKIREAYTEFEYAKLARHSKNFDED